MFRVAIADRIHSSKWWQHSDVLVRLEYSFPPAPAGSHHPSQRPCRFLLQLSFSPHHPHPGLACGFLGMQGWGVSSQQHLQGTIAEFKVGWKARWGASGARTKPPCLPVGVGFCELLLTCGSGDCQADVCSWWSVWPMRWPWGLGWRRHRQRGFSGGAAAAINHLAQGNSGHLAGSSPGHGGGCLHSIGTTF